MDGRKLRTKETRKKLIQASKLLFEDIGYQDTTVNKITKKAKTAHGTFYSHFSMGKDEVLNVILEEVMEEFYQIIQIDFLPNSKAEAYEINYNQIYQFLSLANKHKKMLNVFHESLGKSEIISNRWDKFLKTFYKRIYLDIEYAVKRKLAKENLEIEIIAKILLRSGENFLWEIVKEETNKSVKTISENIAQLYMHGLYY